MIFIKLHESTKRLQVARSSQSKLRLDARKRRFKFFGNFYLGRPPDIISEK